MNAVPTQLLVNIAVSNRFDLKAMERVMFVHLMALAVMNNPLEEVM